MFIRDLIFFVDSFKKRIFYFGRKVRRVWVVIMILKGYV